MQGYNGLVFLEVFGSDPTKYYMNITISSTNIP
jgi:hypothetical protein